MGPASVVAGDDRVDVANGAATYPEIYPPLIVTPLVKSIKFFLQLLLLILAQHRRSLQDFYQL